MTFKLNILLWCCFIVACSSCAQKTTKINGVSFVASRDSVNTEQIKPVLNIGSNYAAVMPFGFIRNKTSPSIVFNTQRQWFGETAAGTKQYIGHLQNHGVQVMIKPQIWLWHGEFTGHLKMETEAAWAQLEASYTNFIMEFAQVAQEMNVALFCIGTELEQFIVHRPGYWEELIGKVKTVFKGKLTYAANWDEYKRVPFWKSLDYVGVDAYFPVSESKTPTVEEAIAGWQPWKTELRNLSEAISRPIIFTEFGYRSTDFTGKEPWNSDHKITTVNLEAQHNATQGLFEVFWNEPWFAGGFVWKWFINHEKAGGKANAQFTPQNKPVEQIIKNYYSNK